MRKHFDVFVETALVLACCCVLYVYRCEFHEEKKKEKAKQFFCLV